MSAQIVSSDGVAIDYYLNGEADRPVVMLSNSLGTDVRLWELQLHALASRYRVLRYDSRGHGASDAPEGDYSLRRLGLDALNLIDGLGIDRVSFCGISLGGMVGQWLGCHAPERIRSLALCNTSAYMGPPHAWDVRIANVRVGGILGIAEGVLNRWFTPRFVTQSRDIVERARSMLLGTSPGGYIGCCAAIRDMDLRGMGSRIAAPTLVIGGIDDPATPASHAEALAAEIPNARLVMLPAAHLSNLEQPEKFSLALLKFLGETADPVEMV
jgi:3-oxoadipate enol-lactonase